MTLEPHYSAKSAASASAFVARSATESSTASTKAAPRKKTYSQSNGIPIRIDNLPPGKTWAQVKYLIGGIIYHTNILQVKMLPPMTSMVPPFITFQSCIVILKNSIDNESLENLLLTLNTYQWDYHDLFVYLLPYTNDSPSLRYPEISDSNNDVRSAPDETKRSISPRYASHVSSVTPQPPSASTPPSQFFSFSPEVSLRKNESITPLPTPVPVPVGVPPLAPPPHGPFSTSMLPMLGAPPGTLPNMQMPYQTTLPSPTAAATTGGPLASPTHYPRRRHFYHQNQSQFQKYMHNSPRNPDTGTGPRLSQQHHLSLRNNKINPSYNEISALYNLNMASNSNNNGNIPTTSTNGDDRALQAKNGGTITPSQTQINHKRLKHIFNEKSFRKQMTNRGMWQLKIINFPPYIPIEFLEKLSESDFNELMNQEKFTVIEIKEKGQLEKFGRLRWTVLKDFIKLKCPKLLRLQERQFLQQQNEASLLNESMDALKISENENTNGSANNSTYTNGGPRTSINNTREFYVGVYEDHEEATLLRFKLPEDELEEFNRNLPTTFAQSGNVSDSEGDSKAKYFKVSTIVYNAIVGFHDKELSDLTFESLQDQEYSLGYKIQVMELPPFDEDEFENQRQQF
ncbi:ADI_G0030760.mRNA.1.CDS.1 [Saccharomyces cerevisiae]|uniref:YIL055Cp-like protein n=4 Tax=Saccharomyces cerevisiae TaxID=4932 RepID=N1P946_YEASC